jgi:hypothetical protein
VIVHETLEAAWQRAVEQWDDPARHEVLIGLVAQHSAFAWAAAKYKARAGDPIADAQLERLRKSVTATMLATATVRPTAGDRARVREGDRDEAREQLDGTAAQVGTLDAGAPQSGAALSYHSFEWPRSTLPSGS